MTLTRLGYLVINDRSQILRAGCRRSIGLPYTLRWQFPVTESRYPLGFSLEAWGDFNGRGTWTLAQDDDFVNVTYDWKVRADKPLLKALSFLFKPLFSANHKWAMARGEESLRVELARLRLNTAGRDRGDSNSSGV